MPSGDVGLVAVPGPVTKIPQHGTGDRRNNRWPQRWALEILAAAGLRGCTGRDWWPMGSASICLPTWSTTGSRRRKTNDLIVTAFWGAEPVILVRFKRLGDGTAPYRRVAGIAIERGCTSERSDDYGLSPK